MIRKALGCLHCNRIVVSVLGLISIHGLGLLIFLESRLNSRNYVEILSNHVVDYVREAFGNNECIYVTDNCPAHKARIVKQWFDSCSEVHSINFKQINLSPYSPDLNIIENVWGLMKKDFLDNGLIPTTRNEVKTMIIDWWDSKRNVLFVNH